MRGNSLQQAKQLEQVWQLCKTLVALQHDVQHGIQLCFAMRFQTVPSAYASLHASGDTTSSNGRWREVAEIGGLPSESRARSVQTALDDDLTEEALQTVGAPSCLLQSCHALCSGQGQKAEHERFLSAQYQQSSAMLKHCKQPVSLCTDYI